MSEYDYTKPPHVIDSYIWSDNVGRLHMMLGWLGLGRLIGTKRGGDIGRTEDGRLGRRRYRLSDGTEAQRYPVNPNRQITSAISRLRIQVIRQPRINESK